MLSSNSYYKGEDICNDNLRALKKGYLNPYEYNFESNLKDQTNNDLNSMKSKCHSKRWGNKISK